MAFDPPAGPSYNVINYDFDKDPPRLAYAASITNAATYNPSTGEIEFDDMNAFKEAGGKLLIWHGWADASVPPQQAVDFYEALDKKRCIATADFARLFMVPEWTTRQDRPRRMGIDPLTALEQWVEEGSTERTNCPSRHQTAIKRSGDVRSAHIPKLHYRGSSDRPMRRASYVRPLSCRDYGGRP